MRRLIGLFVALVVVTACSDAKKNCSTNDDCENGAFCSSSGCAWGCFQDGVGCPEGGWCHPDSGQCFMESPRLLSFTASASSVARGELVVLEWNVLGATTITIDNGVGDVTGKNTVEVNPSTTATNTYTLTASNEYGTVTDSTTVAIICTTDEDCSPETEVCNEKWRICTVASCTGMPDFTPCEKVTDPDLSYDICVDDECVSPGTCDDASCNVPGPHFTLADTGQRACYDEYGTPFGECPAMGAAFYGQDGNYGWDADHADNSERFTRDTAVADQPIVVDHVTGLTWQDGHVSGLSWEEALIHCDTLDWRGYVWRLPDPYELESIADLGTHDPAVDGGFFQSIASESPYAWTSSIDGLDPTQSRIVGLGSSGLLCLPKVIIPDIDDEEVGALCVRSEPAAMPTPRFAPHGTDQPVVEDKATKLVWQGCMAGKRGTGCDEPDAGIPSYFTWGDALVYCETLDWGGYEGGWRLPSRKELASIVSHRVTGSNAAIDGTAFPNTATTWFWSSSTDATASDAVWYVIFKANGPAYSADKDETPWVRARCVRNAL